MLIIRKITPIPKTPKYPVSSAFTGFNAILKTLIMERTNKIINPKIALNNNLKITEDLDLNIIAVTINKIKPIENAIIISKICMK